MFINKKLKQSKFEIVKEFINIRRKNNKLIKEKQSTDAGENKPKSTQKHKTHKNQKEK